MAIGNTEGYYQVPGEWRGPMSISIISNFSAN